MGSNKPDNEGNPHAASISPLLKYTELVSTFAQNEAGACNGGFYNGNWAIPDPMTFPYMPTIPQSATPPWRNVHGTHQSYPYDNPLDSLSDLSQLNSLQNPQNKPNYMSRADVPPSLYRPVPDFPCPEGNMALDDIMTVDNVISSPAYFNSFQNPQVNRNLTLIGCNGAAGYQANKGNFHGPQINRNLIGPGGRTPMLCHNQTSGGIGIDDNVNAGAIQTGCRKVDGSFLTLGLGGRAGTRSEFDLNIVDNTNQLEKAISPPLNSSHIQPGSRSSLPLGGKSVGRSSTIVNNFGGHSSLADDTTGLSLSTNNVRLLSGAGVSSSPFHLKPQANIQTNLCTPTNGNVGIIGNRNSRYGNPDLLKGFFGDQATPSGPPTNRSAGLLDSGQIGLSGLPSHPAKHTWIATTQPTPDPLQKCHMQTTQNFLPESSMASPFIGTRGSLVRADHSGQLFPASEGSATHAAESSLFPRRVGAQQAGQLFTASEGSATHAAESSLFPRRIGVQQAGKLGLPQCTVPVQFPQSSLRPPFTTGQPRYGVPAQFSGEYHGTMPVNLSKDLYGPASTTGQEIPIAKGIELSQASNVSSGPFRKRNVIRPPPAAPRVQRRKIATQPSVYPSVPSQPQTVPATTPVHLPAVVAHIKWEGSGGSPQTTGQKCFLCKRDLSFTPEGLVCRPTVPPPVAVLPCAHTFHDECLHKITPKDQSKDPPCIPCAIGEA